MDRVLTRFFGHHGRDRVIHTDARCADLRVVREHTARLRAIRAVTDGELVANSNRRAIPRRSNRKHPRSGGAGGLLAHRK